MSTGFAAGSIIAGDLVQAGSGYTGGTLATTAITGTGAGATFTSVAAAAGDYAAYDQVAVGANEAADIVAITGDATHANALTCGAAACTLVGGTAADTLTGSSSADAIFGNGGNDAIITNGGADLVDLTNTGASATYQLTCGAISDKPTVIFNNNGSAVDVLNLSNALYDFVTAATCAASANCSCQDATFLAE